MIHHTKIDQMRDGDMFIRVGNLKTEKYTLNFLLDNNKISDDIKQAAEKFTHKSTGIYKIVNGKREFITDTIMFDVDIQTPLEGRDGKSYGVSARVDYQRREAIFRQIARFLGCQPYLIIRNYGLNHKDLNRNVLDSMFGGNLKNAGGQIFFKLSQPISNKSVFWQIYKAVQNFVYDSTKVDPMAHGDMAKNPNFKGVWESEFFDTEDTIDIVEFFNQHSDIKASTIFKTDILENNKVRIYDDLKDAFEEYNFKSDMYEQIKKTENHTQTSSFVEVSSPSSYHESLCVKVDPKHKKSGRNNSLFSYLMSLNKSTVENITEEFVDSTDLFENCDIPVGLDSEEFEAVRESVLSYKSDSFEIEVFNTKSEDAKSEELDPILAISERYQKLRGFEIGSETVEDIDSWISDNLVKLKRCIAKTGWYAHEYRGKKRYVNSSALVPQEQYGDLYYSGHRIANMILNWGIADFLNKLHVFANTKVLGVIWDEISNMHSNGIYNYKTFVDSFKFGIVKAAHHHYTSVVNKCFYDGYATHVLENPYNSNSFTASFYRLEYNENEKFLFESNLDALKILDIYDANPSGKEISLLLVASGEFGYKEKSSKFYSNFANVIRLKNDLVKSVESLTEGDISILKSSDDNIKYAWYKRNHKKFDHFKEDMTKEEFVKFVDLLEIFERVKGTNKNTYPRDLFFAVEAETKKTANYSIREGERRAARTRKIKKSDLESTDPPD